MLVGLKAEVGLAPIVRAVYPQADKVLDQVEDKWTQLVNIITTIEAVGASLGLAGDAKIRAAGPLVGQLIQQSAFMAGKEIADTAAYAKASQTIAGGIADLLNSLKEPSVK